MKYQGYYQVFVPVNGETNATYVIYYTNGQFTVNGLRYSYVSSDAYKPAYETLTATACPENTSSLTIPADPAAS